jgi:hypothetical protein
MPGDEGWYPSLYAEQNLRRCSALARILMRSFPHRSPKRNFFFLANRFGRDFPS